VLDLGHIRARQSGNKLFVDFGLTLESNIPFEHAQSVVDSVKSRVREVFPTADVVVDAAPREPSSGDLVEKVRSIAHRSNYQVHDVTAYQVEGRVNVSLDLELDPALTLEAAHEKATRLERQIQGELQEVNTVNVHIEPLLNRVEAANEARSVQSSMEQKLLKLAQETPDLVDVHSVEAHQTGENVRVSLHCTLDSDLPISRVHDITEDLEFRFRKAFPNISKVNIHPEPKGRE
jgi:divalent metal cation (Fe/Co/Zn/Cd) transporter